MRISDWSSDVCSSDLNRIILARKDGRDVGEGTRLIPAANRTIDQDIFARCPVYACPPGYVVLVEVVFDEPRRICAVRSLRESDTLEIGSRSRVERSEEHTSELQSLMRISYAVFCLK